MWEYVPKRLSHCNLFLNYLNVLILFSSENWDVSNEADTEGRIVKSLGSSSITLLLFLFRRISYRCPNLVLTDDGGFPSNVTSRNWP